MPDVLADGLLLFIVAALAGSIARLLRRRWLRDRELWMLLYGVSLPPKR